MEDEKVQVKAVVWKGKPLPSEVVIEGGFKLALGPKEVASKEGVGAMAPFHERFPAPWLIAEEGICRRQEASSV